MTKIKIYTEEQVIALTKAAFTAGQNHNSFIFSEELKKLTPIELPSDSLCINCDESKSTHNVCMDCIIKIGKENIQLPSDEEIREERLLQFPDSEYANRANDRLAFLCGAKFVINKIQGGNNEQQ